METTETEEVIAFEITDVQEDDYNVLICQRCY